MAMSPALSIGLIQPYTVLLDTDCYRRIGRARRAKERLASDADPRNTLRFLRATNYGSGHYGALCRAYDPTL